MNCIRRLVLPALLVLATSVWASADPLRDLLEESKASGKGLILFVNGQSLAAVIVRVDDRFVVARSQAQGTIVLRLERVDGAAGRLALERK